MLADKDHTARTTTANARSSEVQAKDIAVSARINSALSNLQFGAVTITVHAGAVVQIDVMERHRFNP